MKKIAVLLSVIICIIAIQELSLYKQLLSLDRTRLNLKIEVLDNDISSEEYAIKAIYFKEEISRIQDSSIFKSWYKNNEEKTKNNLVEKVKTLEFTSPEELNFVIEFITN